jgi:hypothetical protein
MERPRTVIEVQLVAARRAYSYQFAQSHLAKSSKHHNDCHSTLPRSRSADEIDNRRNS